MKSLKEIWLIAYTVAILRTFYGNQPAEKNFYHSPAHIVKCVSENIFLFSKSKQTSKKKPQTNKNTKKSKETKEEKRIHTENGLKQ